MRSAFNAVNNTRNMNNFAPIEFLTKFLISLVTLTAQKKSQLGNVRTWKILCLLFQVG